MLKILIIAIIISFVLWKGKPFLKGMILKYREKGRNNAVEYVEKDLIYTPVLSSRVFHFSIEIEEVGNGRASIKVVKNKDN